jgi:hypothetical protein
MLEVNPNSRGCVVQRPAQDFEAFVADTNYDATQGHAVAWQGWMEATGSDLEGAGF